MSDSHDSELTHRSSSERLVRLSPLTDNCRVCAQIAGPERFDQCTVNHGERSEHTKTVAGRGKGEFGVYNISSVT